MRHPALEYFRLDRPGSPNLWCPGCGIGQVWYYTVQAINELGLDHDKVVWVGGSGCSGRMCTYWYKDSMHTLHGRPLGFATGIKLANPELTVICHMGDGETSAIGGNHLIQTARRNVELTAICINNFNYGMTGGQYSPTTPTRWHNNDIGRGLHGAAIRPLQTGRSMWGRVGSNGGPPLTIARL